MLIFQGPPIQVKLPPHPSPIFPLKVPHHHQPSHISVMEQGDPSRYAFCFAIKGVNFYFILDIFFVPICYWEQGLKGL